MPVCIVRIWKRDCSRNYMGVDDALNNLEWNGVRLADAPEQNAELTRGALLRGDVLQTPLAWFVIEPGSAEAPAAA